MKLLVGSKTQEAPSGWREEVDGRWRQVVIDVGAGDGRYAYEEARRNPDVFYIALDPDVSALSEYAFKASRKPARGGVTNVAFVVASLEALPQELAGLADIVRVNFPWAGLLRALLLPEPSSLAALASLARPDGRFEIILTYDPSRDAAALEGAALPQPDEGYIDTVLSPAYASAGIEITGRRRLPLDEALALPSTWGRRLLHGRPRTVWRIEARRALGAPEHGIG